MATKPGIADLLAWWQLDEASGDRSDSHDGGYTLTDHNTVGTAQGGADFNDANSEYLDTSDTDLSWGDEPFTISGWIWMDDWSTDHSLVTRWSNTGSNRQFFLQASVSGTKWRLNIDPDGAGTSDTDLYNTTKGGTTGEWIFFAFFHDPDANQIGLRINGDLQTQAWGNGVSGATGGNFSLGRNYSLGRYLDGKMKCVNVWEDVLTSDELDWLYNSGSARTYDEVAGDNFDEWTESENGTIERDATTYIAGSYSAKLTADADHSANPCYIEQNITVLNGVYYTLEGWVKGDYRITLTGDSNTDTDTGSAASWTQVSVEILADQTTITARLEPADDDDVAYFDDFTVKATYPANWELVKFLGTLYDIHPYPGRFEFPVSECIVHDWMGYANDQEIGIQAIQSNKTADEALTTLLTEFPNQPPFTDFDEGNQEFELVFAGDDKTKSMAAMFATLMKNERGRLYVKGDGTLVFENNSARDSITEPSFVLDGTMSNIDVQYSVSNIFNVVSLELRTTVTDSAATAQLFNVGKGILIPAGESITLECSFTDESTGQKVAATDVVTPLASFKFGSSRLATSSDLTANLDDTNYVVGATSMTVDLENTGGTDGYLNEFKVYGARITDYDTITVTAEDTDSKDQVGPRKYETSLMLIEDQIEGQTIADEIIAKFGPSHIKKCEVDVVANIDSDLGKQLVLADVSTRFTAIESVTGIESDFFINHIEYTQDYTLLRVHIIAEEA